MPKGVEHSDGWVVVQRPGYVLTAVMPKGVEHVPMCNAAKLKPLC